MGVAFKAAGRVAYPVKKTMPAWARELAKKVRELGKFVKEAQLAMMFSEQVNKKATDGKGT